MSKVWVINYMSDFLVFLSLSDVHRKLTLNLALINVMDQFPRCRCVHGSANPLDVQPTEKSID